MSIEQANLKRDRRLRRGLLLMLHAGRAGPCGGWLGGQFLIDLFGPESSRKEKCGDEQQLLGLLRDLVAKAFAEERDDRTRRSESFCLASLSFRITASGGSLLNETIGPDPDIDDERIARRA